MLLYAKRKIMKHLRTGIEIALTLSSSQHLWFAYFYHVIHSSLV